MILVAGIAGAAGAVIRYVVSGAVQERARTAFPVGTLVVNLTGALVLGVIAGIDDLQSTASLIGAGFLGGFTTFSTWMIESIRLGPTLGRRAVANLTLTLVVGVALAAAGYSLMM